MPAVTEEWFRRRTTRWQDWDPAVLRAAKEARGLTVSLVLPARNEAATVGGIVARLRRDLVRGAGLVDELVVVDSDSTDDTARQAAHAGATVHRAADIRPDLGTRPGKGEALWKALFVTGGDVLVFLDADLVEWDTHFVTGLLGPLLAGEDVQLVKGCYERPPVAADGAPAEGGRVTELVARPLLALRWPDMAGVVQPLAGEWAVRRRLLERLAVPTGYGVELGVLVDTYLTAGLDAVAQVHLGRRTHQHQTLRDLGAMALELLVVADRRAGLEPAAGPVQLRQYPPDADGSTCPGELRDSVLREVAADERPPAATVPGYPARPAGVAPGGTGT